MQGTGGWRVLVCAAEGPAGDSLSRLLENAGLSLTRGPAGGPDADTVADCDLIVCQAEGRTSEAAAFCRRLRKRAPDRYVPVLVLTDDAEARGLCLDAGADACLPVTAEPAELVAQVRALARLGGLCERLAERTGDAHRINRQLQAFHERVSQELELARKIQSSLLPRDLPVVPGARFAVHYQPRDRVGGDFYDVFRLDETHVGFYVADAMGHGIPACLLTVFLKKAVRAKDILSPPGSAGVSPARTAGTAVPPDMSGHGYRLVPPGEVLERLNRDLVEQGLAENPFVTMVCGLFDCRTGRLRFARAGHPHPLHVPALGEAALLEVPGSLLGVFETRFTTRECVLRPGDKVLFHTDGTEAVSYEGHAPGSASMAACAARHRALPPEDFVARVANDLVAGQTPADDVTLLALEYQASGG